MSLNAVKYAVHFRNAFIDTADIFNGLLLKEVSFTYLKI